MTAAYRFCFGKRLWISWFPQLRFCGRCRNLEITITITIRLRTTEFGLSQREMCAKAASSMDEKRHRLGLMDINCNRFGPRDQNPRNAKYSDKNCSILRSVNN